jgi:hypothetical protein
MNIGANCGGPGNEEMPRGLGRYYSSGQGAWFYQVGFGRERRVSFDEYVNV